MTASDPVTISSSSEGNGTGGEGGEGGTSGWTSLCPARGDGGGAGGWGTVDPVGGEGERRNDWKLRKSKTVIDTHNIHYCTCISTIDARLHKLI